MGSSPLFLRSWKDFNLRKSLYQSGPWAFRHSSWGYSCGGNPVSAIGKAACHRISASVIGRKFFHTRCISWSYRNRG